MSEKSELIYRCVLILLIVAFLAIFYRYSENGRYTYHKEIGGLIDNKYVLDTRTGIVYGEVDSSVGRSNFYEKDFKTGQILLKPHKITGNIYKESEKPPSK